MNHPATETPAAPPAGEASRMMGVITSPDPTFAEVARRPGWIAPFVFGVGVFFIIFGIYASRADWVAITTDYLENAWFMNMMPDEARDRAVSEATSEMRKMTQGQLVVSNLLNFPVFVVAAFHFMGVLYATIFVLMGSLPKLELGKAWVNFLLCLLLMVPYIGVSALAQRAFQEAMDSRLLLVAVTTAAVCAAWIWLLNRRAIADPEYHGIVSVYAYASLVMILSSLAVLAVVLATPPPIQLSWDKLIKTNVGALVQTGVPALQKALGWIDVFWIWFIALLSIGFKHVTRMSMGIVVSMTVLPFAVIALIQVAIAAVTG